jgi:hypothetical protein
MISPLGFRMVRSDGRIHSLGHFHIGGIACCVWALPPVVYGRFRPTPGELPKGTYRFMATRPLRSQRQSNLCCSDMGLGSWRWLSHPPLGEAQAPQARGVHGLHRHVEYPTVADAVIETRILTIFKLEKLL